ncbi:uncharacterized protein B0I36DRAFT_368125 [Microdochium trichocladiopsis]|uniref:CFEM domain-containing protein n=1 Tax=Microdochium trichocladiopsis TaxID=1682393 RepID=A0A9P9BMR7_9PEZI|nr:uncharacterized protein B0I36DRAFT_368125 [Microdochium trichocladiopsis]KAH7018077.1 hypothetical protein B0I36DRAFT_368125 [Microdochium trichocladiopsis]
MKAVLVLSALVGAVSANTLPSCAQSCVTKFTSGSNIGSCPSSNAACICKNTALLGDFACCLSSGCSKGDQTSAVSYAHSICSAQGVTVPTAVVCSS